MSTLTSSSAESTANHRPEALTIRSWLMTLNPVSIAGRFAGVFFVFSLLALLAGLLLRVELLTPATDSISPRTFGALLSLHGMLMMYFVALPAIPGMVGHALLPGVLGERGFVLPRLMRTSWQLLGLGGAIVSAGFFFGGTEVGWSLDTAFGGHFSAPGIAPAAIGILLAATGIALMSLNIAVTIAVHRPALSPMPPLASSLFFASLLGLIASPILAGCTATALADHLFNLAIFSPGNGGSPELFSAIFRRFSIPAQNMVLISGLGVAAHVIVRRTGAQHLNTAFGRVFGVMAVAGTIAWGGTGFPVWGGWMALPFTIGMTICSGLIILFCVLALRRGLHPLDTAAVYALAFFILLSGALVTGLLLAMPIFQQYLGNSTFATAHMHFTMTALLGLALMAGLHEAWPIVSGRTCNEIAGRLLAGLVFVAIHLAAFPLYAAGRAGAPFRANSYAPEFTVMNVMAFAGTTLLVAALLAALINLIVARRRAVAL